MRLLLSMLISVMLLASCILAPDSVNLTVRSGDRMGIQGMNFGVTYNNPWKPRHVVRENWLIPREGEPGGENL